MPLERRLQTAAMLFLLTSPLLLLVFVAATLSSSWGRVLLLAVYPAWIVYDYSTPWRGGRPSQSLRNTAITRLAKAYFPSQLVVTKALPITQPSLICVHPHGVISAGVVTTLVLNNAAHTAAHRIGDYRVATVKINMVMPIWRELLLGVGFIDASREGIGYCLSRGISVVVVVGGAAESLDAYPGSTDLVLSKRTGFIKLALQHGAALVCYGGSRGYNRFLCYYYYLIMSLVSQTRAAVYRSQLAEPCFTHFYLYTISKHTFTLAGAIVHIRGK